MRYWNDNLYLTEDELAHHGVLGMKWGVRRYQNYDGSLKGGSKKKSKKKWSTGKKVAVTAGVAVAAGLAIYGGYKVNKLAKGINVAGKAIINKHANAKQYKLLNELGAVDAKNIEKIQNLVSESNIVENNRRIDTNMSNVFNNTKRIAKEWKTGGKEILKKSLKNQNYGSGVMPSLGNKKRLSALKEGLDISKIDVDSNKINWFDPDTFGVK